MAAFRRPRPNGHLSNDCPRFSGLAPNRRSTECLRLPLDHISAPLSKERHSTIVSRRELTVRRFHPPLVDTGSGPSG